MGEHGRHRPECPGPGLCTLDSGMDEREVIAARGWLPGTVLVGEEGYGDSRIRIEYVGPDVLVCTWLDHGRESLTTLSCRCWCEADATRSSPGR